MARPQDIFSNMLGQIVDVSHPDTDSGYYLATDEAVAALNAAGLNRCPDGMRPGRMVIKGLPASDKNPEGYINTCGGKISQEDMPDIHVIDWQYRPYMSLALMLIVLIMVGAIGLKLFK